MANSIKQFMTSARGHHIRNGNLKAVDGGLALTLQGMAWFASRLDASARSQFGVSGETVLAAAREVVTNGKAGVWRYGARTVELVEVDPAVDGTSARCKVYLHPRHCVAGDALSQAFYSAQFV